MALTVNGIIDLVRMSEQGPVLVHGKSDEVLVLIRGARFREDAPMTGCFVLYEQGVESAGLSNLLESGELIEVEEE